jgi:CheY-like chemotaxis protein
MASISQIAARVCEDLLEPARAASRALELLARAPMDDGCKAQLEIAARANARILTILETAAELRAADAGQLVLDPRPRRLRELMDEVEARWRSRAKDAGVRLMVSYDGDPECAVMVDWVRLLLVIDALVGRALASVGEGVVEASLTTRATDEGIVVACRVRDDRGDLAARNIDELLNAAIVRDGDGAAVTMALALAARLVEAMGGSLAIQPNVGPGSTLAFDLVMPPSRDTGQEPDVRAPGGRAAHILVVDDNATNRMVVEALCEMFECSTESVADGVEAVEAARVGRFDVILMDIKMPRMDGVTATGEIRKLRGAAGLPPIIALTANAGPEDVRAYLAAGMCAVVEKPIKAERLLEALEGALAGDGRSTGKTAAAA